MVIRIIFYLFVLVGTLILSPQRLVAVSAEDSVLIAQYRNSLYELQNEAPKDTVLALIESLENLATKIQDTSSLAYAIRYRAKLAYREGDTLGAIDLFQQSAEIIKPVDLLIAGYRIDNIGDLLVEMGRNAEAIERYEEALTHLVFGFDWFTEKQLLYTTMVKHAQAMKDEGHEPAIKDWATIYHADTNDALKFHILLATAGVHKKFGDFARGSRDAHAALGLALQFDLPIMLYRAYAVMAVTMLDPERKMKYENKALQILDTMGEARPLLLLLNNMGNAATDLEDWPEVIRITKRTIEVNRSTGFNHLWHYLYSYSRMARAYRCLGEIGKAKVALDSAKSYLYSEDWHAEIVQIKIEEAMILFQEGNHKGAYRIILEAEDHNNKTTGMNMYLEMRMDLFKHMATIAEKAGDHRKAYVAYQNYIEIRDSVASERNIRMVVKKDTEFKLQEEVVADSLAKVEQMRMEEAELIRISTEKAERNRIQISGVILFVLFLFMLIVLSGKLNLSENTAEGLIFVFFILLFEFILVVMDPWVDEVSNGEVIVKLALNSSFALILFFGHHYFAQRLKATIVQEPVQRRL
jgi:tetratricopeptide (TPR) repeat protein